MIANHISRQVGPLVQQRIDHLSIGQKMQDLPEELWHASFRYYVKEDPNRAGGPNLRMLRLHPDRPSPTVTGYIFNKFVHPFENRFISVREAARLQGFPDNFNFYGSLTSTQLQVGNATPVQLAQALFKSLLEDAATFGFGTQPLTALSLFSGAGGLDIGATQTHYNNSSIQTKLSVDNWQDACRSLQSFYGNEGKVIEQDLAQVADPTRFWIKSTNEHTPPDLIYGGPPCQSFSQAGKQKGVLDDRGQLVFDFIRFVENLKPKFFLMENVSNLKGVGEGLLYNQLIIRMTEIGYNVTVKPLVAADYGTPQLRKRLIFLGCRKDIGWLKIPEPQYSPNPNFFTQTYQTVRDAFQGLPNLKDG